MNLNEGNTLCQTITALAKNERTNQQAIEKLVKSINITSKLRADKETALSELIKKGAWSHGDPVTDYLFLKKGSVLTQNPESVEKQIRDLTTELQKYVPGKEFVLVIETRKEVYDDGMRSLIPRRGGSDPEYVLNEYYTLGVLGENGIVFDPKETCRIDTGGKCVPVKKERNADTLKSVDQNIDLDWFGFHVARIEILVGDSTLKEFLEKKDDEVLLKFWEAAKLLDRKLPEIPKLAEILKGIKKGLENALVKSFGDFCTTDDNNAVKKRKAAADLKESLNTNKKFGGPTIRSSMDEITRVAEKMLAEFAEKEKTA